MDYWEFCRRGMTPLTEEEMASQEESLASEKDIQYWKGLKMRLAMRHLKQSMANQGAGATIAELDYILNKRPKTNVPNIIYQRALEREF